MTAPGLLDFVIESNRIEGIRTVRDVELQAHERLLALPFLTRIELCDFVTLVAEAPLRDQPGIDVIVGNHYPPRGGTEVRLALQELLTKINNSGPGGGITPYAAHQQYETLHAFLDGNGRSGRAVWAWHMLRVGQDPFALPFLQRWYYQSLDAQRP